MEKHTSVSSEIVQILMVILCVHLFFAVIKFWFEVLNLISVNMCVQDRESSIHFMKAKYKL